METKFMKGEIRKVENSYSNEILNKGVKIA